MPRVAQTDPRRQSDAARHVERHGAGVQERLAVGEAGVLQVLGEEHVEVFPGRPLRQRVVRLLGTAIGDDAVVGDKEAEGAVRVADSNVVDHVHAAALQPEAVAAVTDVQRMVIGILLGDRLAVIVAGVEAGAVRAARPGCL